MSSFSSIFEQLTKAMAPPTLSQVLLEASAIQMVNGGCGHFC